MKKVIKKAAVMVFSAMGALLAVPAAFGSSTEPANLNLQRRDVNPVRDGRRIDIANSSDSSRTRPPRVRPMLPSPWLWLLSS